MESDACRLSTGPRDCPPPSRSKEATIPQELQVVLCAHRAIDEIIELSPTKLHLFGDEAKQGIAVFAYPVAEASQDASFLAATVQHEHAMMCCFFAESFS